MRAGVRGWLPSGWRAVAVAGRLCGMALATLVLVGAVADAAEATPDRSPAVRQAVAAALEAKGPAYRPRTRHLLEDGRPRYTNRLILEDSPYLLQHAHNPVDWYPWGDAAFAKARRENKLIFLSIGYSTCHWCHVMERESFESTEIADLLGDAYVAVKVDRERRPDLDHLYMTAVTLLAGSGGWPLTVLLTPDGQPVAGGSYFTADELGRLLRDTAKRWRDHPGKLKRRAAMVASAVAQAMSPEAGTAELPADLGAVAVDRLLRHHDARLGGFGGAPKFPNEPRLSFLLDRLRRTGDPDVSAVLARDLDAIAAGGIHDQLGGGFHRYATDDAWREPHFEKMLYNQALLTSLYLGAARPGVLVDGTGSERRTRYARVARRAVEFVLREMSSPDGGFFSALDAESGGGEGHYYLWSEEEVRNALGEEEARVALQRYGLAGDGGVPHRPSPSTAEIDAVLPRERLDAIDDRLLATRRQRSAPQPDEKVITGWNALMIRALAEAADLLGEPRYLDVATRTAEFLWQRHRRPDGGLWRASLGGRASGAAMLDDYAYLAEAFLVLYDVTGRTLWLSRAALLADALQERFLDRRNGGYFLAEADAATPLARPRDSMDRDLPSGTGVAVQVLVALAARTGELRFETAARAVLAALAGSLRADPVAHVTLLSALDRHRAGEVGPYRYAGQGTVRMAARLLSHDLAGEAPGVVLEVMLAIRPGWHVNAHRPLQDNLIPTALVVADPAWRLDEIDYPAGTVVTLGFQSEPLALYEGDINLRARLQPAGGQSGKIALDLRVQPCSERVCLAPESLRFIFAGGTHH